MGYWFRPGENKKPFIFWASLRKGILPDPNHRSPFSCQLSLGPFRLAAVSMPICRRHQVYLLHRREPNEVLLSNTFLQSIWIRENSIDHRSASLAWTAPTALILRDLLITRHQSLDQRGAESLVLHFIEAGDRTALGRGHLVDLIFRVRPVL